MADGSPQPGDTFNGRYRLESLLGEGGFAHVFVAQDLELERRVALKILRASRASEQDVTRFMREMRVVASLQSPNIVTIYDFGRADDTLFMVCELVPGENLGDVIRRGPIPEIVVIHVIKQLLNAIQDAHEAGILHRDIKPANIRIFTYKDDDWRLKLLDFGIARAEHHAHLTATGASVGTPRFMAPEQLFGDPLTPMTDLYAVALVAYEMLTHRHNDALHKLANSIPVVFDDSDPVSPALRAVLERMLETETSGRYRTAADVLAALAAIGSHAPPISRGVPVSHVSAIAPETPSAITDSPTWERSPGLSRNTLGIALVVVVLVIAVLVATNRGPKTHKVSDTHARNLAPLLAKGAPTADKPAEVATADVEPETPADAPGTGCGSPPPFFGRDVLDLETPTLAYIPQSYHRHHSHALIVAFHHDGNVISRTKDHDLALFTQSGFAPIADKHQFVVLYPQGIAADVEGIMAWRNPALLEGISRIVRDTRQTLCIDHFRIFLVGIGRGGFAAGLLACEPWVAGFATVSHLLPEPVHLCDENVPVPYLSMVPRDSRWVPIKGGPTYNAQLGSAAEAFGLQTRTTSLASIEEMWRTRNACTKSNSTWHKEKAGTCMTWQCGGAPFVSCKTAGGFGWPGEKLPLDYAIERDIPAGSFPASEVIWRFFDSLKVERPQPD